MIYQVGQGNPLGVTLSKLRSCMWLDDERTSDSDKSFTRMRTIGTQYVQELFVSVINKTGPFLHTTGSIRYKCYINIHMIFLFSVTSHGRTSKQIHN